MRKLVLGAALICALAMSAQDSGSQPANKDQQNAPAAQTQNKSETRMAPPAKPTEVDKYKQMIGGLEYADLVEGTGREVKNHNEVSVHYTGWLTNGKMFDSSLLRGKPFEFEVGARRVIKGWEQGVLGMKVGGKRQLRIPPDLGYGERGIGPIPPNATLIFEIEVLDVR